MPNHTLLCVDDEVNILHALQRVFRKEGYELVTAIGGEEALRKLEGTPVSLVLSDQRMPGLSGTEFLQRVRDRWPDTMRIMLTGYADIKAAISAINQGEVYRFITKPWQEEDLKLTVKQALRQYELVAENKRLLELTAAQNAELWQLNEQLEAKVAARTEDIRRKNELLDGLNRELEKNFLDSIKVFAGLLELRDYFAGSHSKRVAAAAKFMAERYGFAAAQVQDVENAAILHDIGKIGIPDATRKKDEKEMTKAELESLEQHPILGQASVHIIDRLQPAGFLIRHHHERYDGQGYPDGLKGENIPLGARIIAVANVFDILVSKGLRNRILPQDQALKFLLDNRGTQFDPMVVDYFLEFLKARNQAAASWGERKIWLDQLRENMVLSRDLYTRRGLLLAAKDEVIKASYIEKIRNYHRIDPIVDGIFVYQPRS